MSRQQSIQYGSAGVLIQEIIPGDGISRAQGTTVPTDATAGYAKGCVFVDTDASALSILYVNEGSNTSCDFNAVAINGAATTTITTLTATTASIAQLFATATVVGQGAPTAKSGVATIAIADILTGIVTLSHTVGATVALTLDTGTAMDAGDHASMGTDQAIDWYLINLSAAAADTGTLTAAGGHTIVGNPIVQSAHVSTGGITGNSAHFRSRRTATNTWITYRVG